MPSTTIADIVAHVVSTPVLLVASDFDGTLAPLVSSPTDAAPHPAALRGLQTLCTTPSTHVAILSGRGLEDVRRRLGGPRGWHFSGSHGAEVEGETSPPLSPDAESQLRDATLELRSLEKEYAGCFVETKPRGVAFHYRAAVEHEVGGAIERVTALAQVFPALSLRLGSMVLELTADRVTKGDALRLVRRRTGATGVLFVGDDLTDERAFAALAPPDASVKVGAGDTVARFRVQDVEEVAQLLTLLAQERQAWAASRSLVPINAHAMLSDQRTVALLTPRGRITWLCLPRIDSPPVFAELLHDPSGGFFDITPLDESAEPVQSYEDDSMIVRTRWSQCAITDYLDCGGGRVFQRAGRSDLIRVVEGASRCRVVFAPRLDFGRMVTRLRVREHGLQVEGGADHMLLYAPGVTWTIREEGPHQTAFAEVDPRSGTIVFELRAGTANDKPHVRSEPDRRRETLNYWHNWTASLRLPMLARTQVRRSAILLRSLVQGPTGAIAAAGTTSLPEHLGGQRNWDYRYCWPRDAAMAAAALVRLGNTGTAMRYLDWLVQVFDRCESPEKVRPMYAVDGQLLGPEAEIGGLRGYGGSVPVRVNNAAAHQVQRDVFGPIVDLIALLAESGAPVSPEHWRLTRAIVDAVSSHWMDADHGIWELRTEKKHHVHSKAMGYFTVDRALVVHEAVTGAGNAEWAQLRDRIRDDVLAHGVDARTGTFTSSYGSTAQDAATLWVGLSGLVSMRDPRFQATVAAIERELCEGNAVYRYHFDDGLPGREGAFHLCTGWLIEAMAHSGRLDDAHALFESLLENAGPTGLLAEQVDPATGMALGNVPQAYSHLAVINAAVTLERAGAFAQRAAEHASSHNQGARP